eukprot:4493163-Prymnesium_polylepis.1
MVACVSVADYVDDARRVACEELAELLGVAARDVRPLARSLAARGDRVSLARRARERGDARRAHVDEHVDSGFAWRAGSDCISTRLP